MIKKNKSLKILKLGRFVADGKYIEQKMEIISSFKFNFTISNIEFSFFNLNDEFCIHLSNMLNENHTLEYINLSHNKITNIGYDLILNSLKLVFDKKGTITAGTASPFTDGASATLICNEEYAKKNNLDILAKVVSTSVQGCPPELMGLGPIGASKKALKRANLTIEDIDVVELNEAFASQSLACIKDLNIDPQKVNIDGGAIALGHPLGATGARITAKAAQILKREKKKYALATQCIGLGQGIATILESY